MRVCFLLRARPGLTHSRFFLWKCFIGSAPERRTAHRTKKNTSSFFFFFAPRAARAHSLTLLFVEMFYRLGPERRTAHRTKKKHVQWVFFLLPARPGLTHSRFFLWKCFIGSAPERRTAHRTKKKHVQSAFFFCCCPRGPGSLTHLFRSSNIINVGNRKRNARGTKKTENGTHTEQKKKLFRPCILCV